ncbi:MAG TPA: DNA-directed RNA polymerase subunit beta [Candidatus Cloacimonetes bacterium]|nr:DNA-directed RNA polymerase subunit beta [Candidatus Cloacimonadota bacterium]HEX37869.1 DNA-directed RNA polymerase subunit beta [Candidatus Cloacimonadota bacterium]
MKERKNFSKMAESLHGFKLPEVEVPNLLTMQMGSYSKFLQKDVLPEKRKNIGLQEVFNNHFPVEDTQGQFLLEFIQYNILKEKYTPDECIERNLTYSSPLKVKFRLTTFEKTVEGEQQRVKSVKEKDLFLGEIPMITDRGTFIINGEERVIISQLHRSPGVTFTSETHGSGKILYNAKVIPVQGSWFQFVTDAQDVVYVLIDKRHKVPVTTILRCLGLSDNNKIRENFYHPQELDLSKEEFLDRVLFSDIIDKKSGEIIAEGGALLNEGLVDKLLNAKVKKVQVIPLEQEDEKKIIESTLSKDPTSSEEEALKFIYNIIRPGEEPPIDTARELINRIFFNPKRYSLGEVGRYKINKRLHLDIPIETQILTIDDFIAIIKEIVSLIKGLSTTDDIDHLSNRRVSGVGELVANQFSIGLSRVARIARERMTLSSSDDASILGLVNTNALMAVVNSFFLTGELSQFMEQTNPLAAITHMRRLSALGPGGLTRERAGFEVRDVHYSHYGRICPIETPEGPNIGLLTSPALYARVNQFGFLETPYIKVENGTVTGKVDYLDPTQEENMKIAQAGIEVDKKGNIMKDRVMCLTGGDFVLVPKEEVDYIDSSRQQIVSVSAGLIPFLDHDDANRALMGSNMQRQAVPLIKPQPPTVATGIEKIVAKDSELAIKAPFDAIVEKATSDKIVLKRILSEEDKDSISALEEERTFTLKKFQRTNQETCINQHPEVTAGQKVKKGQLITDGPAIKNSELALGTNMIVAFMPWYGYNYEDAIIVSEKVAREDELTSIYIEELEVLVRSTREGDEELTDDIPNVPKFALRNLDGYGVVRVGSHIKSGDILVGKITPKSSNVDLSPEEKLMRALFGERAGDFSDTSLKAKPGMEGVVVDVKVFSKAESDELSDAEKEEKLTKLKNKYDSENKKIYKYLKAKLSDLLLGETAYRITEEKTGRFFIPPNTKISKEELKKISFRKLNLDSKLVTNDKKNEQIYEEVIIDVKNALEENDNNFKKQKDRVKYGDELPSGVLKMVKIYIAKKRQVEVGDKMAGRHGNKGVIAKIAPIEDMPFLQDGTPVDIILNPLGVPSRMNIGQILETHLGWAARALGYDVETPVFDGATIKEITEQLKKAKLTEDGKVVLYDGKTGEAMHERVTVGVIYMMKLNHLVVDKMHARSTGPYSLVTQQPLGGKAQHGGQRLGEMEVWALEAYGASRLLQEMLTVKSDDVDGRNQTYEAITKGKELPEPGIPESFNVLASELKSLCLDFDLLSEKTESSSTNNK